MKYTQLSVRVWEEWLDVIRKAADKAGISTPEYVRTRLLPVACDDLGIQEPEFPPLDKRGRPSPVSQVAQKLGIPAEQWKKQVLTETAEKMLRMFESGAPPAPTVVLRRSPKRSTRS